MSADLLPGLKLDDEFRFCDDSVEATSHIKDNIDDQRVEMGGHCYSYVEVFEVKRSRV